MSITLETNCLILARSVRATLPSLSTSALIADWPETGFLSTSEIASVVISVISTLPSQSTSPRSVVPGAVVSVGFVVVVVMVL